MNKFVQKELFGYDFVPKELFEKYFVSLKKKTVLCGNRTVPNENGIVLCQSMPKRNSSIRKIELFGTKIELFHVLLLQKKNSFFSKKNCSK